MDFVAEKNGMSVEETLMDGNCMFDALSKQLNRIHHREEYNQMNRMQLGEKYNHLRVRQDVVKYLKDHPTTVCILTKK